MTDTDTPIIIGIDENNKFNWNSIISMVAIILGMILIALAKCIQTWLKKKISENKLEIVRTSTTQLPTASSLEVEPSQQTSEKV